MAPAMGTPASTAWKVTVWLPTWPAEGVQVKRPLPSPLSTKAWPAGAFETLSTRASPSGSDAATGTWSIWPTATICAPTGASWGGWFATMTEQKGETSVKPDCLY